MGLYVLIYFMIGGVFGWATLKIMHRYPRKTRDNNDGLPYLVIALWPMLLFVGLGYIDTIFKEKETKNEK